MVWRLIQGDGVGAADGLAVDEVLARRAGAGLSPPTLRLYTYRPHVALVGRFQDVARELHVPFCESNGIEVNRRPTGGGAIIMGPDQLGVALALGPRARGLRARELMARFSQGLVAGLDRLGIGARFRGKNDLEVDGRKIAGLGIYRDLSGGLLFHASVLVDLDVVLMSRVLKTPFAAVTEKELATLASRTSTVRTMLGNQVSMEEVRTCVAAGFAGSFDVGMDRGPGELDAEELEAIEVLAREKYRTEAWVLQRTEVPDTTGAASLGTPGGLLDVRVALAGRMISSVHIRGDFFETEEAMAALEGSLRWHSSDEPAVAATLEEWAQARSEGTVAPEYLVRAIVAAVRDARGSEGATAPYGCFVSSVSAPGEAAGD
jgi:lipoate-protein ligase A